MASDALPKLAWDNLVEDGTITSSGDASGYPKENVQDWRRFVQWKSSASTGDVWLKIDCGASVDASCLGILGHNLYSAGATDVILEGSNDNLNWTELVAAFTPTSDVSIFKIFETAAYRYFRLTITLNGTACLIGIWFVGEYIEFPDYPPPGFDPQQRKLVSEASVNQSGYILGAVKKYIERKVRVRFTDLSRDWVEDNIWPLENEHYPKPFIWAWDTTNHPDDIFLMRQTDADMIHPIDANVVDVELDMIGVYEI